MNPSDKTGNTPNVETPNIDLIESLEALKAYLEAQLKDSMAARDFAKLEIKKRMMQAQTRRKKNG